MDMDMSLDLDMKLDMDMDKNMNNDLNFETERRIKHGHGHEYEQCCAARAKPSEPGRLGSRFLRLELLARLRSSFCEIQAFSLAWLEEY